MVETEKEDERSMDDWIKIQSDALENMRKELVTYEADGNNRRTKAHYEIRFERIAEARANFKEIHRHLVHYKEIIDSTYVKNDIYSEFENAHLDVAARLKSDFDQLFPEPVTTIPVAPNLQSPGHSSSTHQPNPHNITYQLLPPVEPAFKLPQLSVPKFDGFYTEWPQFYDSFLAIHENPQYDARQKFRFLREALSVKVKTIIDYLDITAENYEECWEALVKRFNNQRVLFNNFAEKLINQPNATRETVDELQSIYDTSKACVFSLSKLGLDTDECSTLIAHILLKKIPHATRIEWEKHLGKSVTAPKFKQLMEFLDLRVRTLEAMYPQSAKTEPKENSSSSYKSTRRESKTFHVSAKPIVCPSCSHNHILRKCPLLLQISPSERKQLIARLKYCMNCLGHVNTQECVSTKSCFTCGGRHHTLLHINRPNDSIARSSNAQSMTTSAPSQTVAQIASQNLTLSSNHLVNAKSDCVLLTTALVDIPDITGQMMRLRALIDQGSQHSIITERAAQRLKLPITPICVGIRPMGETQYKIVNRGLNVSIHSLIDSNYSVSTTVAITSSISSNLPLFPLPKTSWPHIQSLPLSDPNFAAPGQIDLLLGGEIYYHILRSGLCRGQDGEPMAQNTAFGWILSGPIFNEHHLTAIQVNSFHISTVEIAKYMKKFYELEEVSNVREMSKEDEWTVEHFKRTHQRQPNGRFMVRLPFKSQFDPTVQLGSTFSMALKRFQALKRRFQRDPAYHQAYLKVFNEYKELNQVRLVDTINDKDLKPEQIRHCYLPHHAIIKMASQTTQYRQVFDASAKSSNGNSLNDLLTTGPPLQNDLVSIMLNWRTHKYVIVADVARMYRCIDVHPDDTPYQRLLWEEDGQLCTYELQTVTFGIKSSPFLAIQSLNTLADTERNTYPLAFEAIKKETYVDDVTSGNETIKATIELTNQLIAMLRGGGFELRKWASNSPEILQHIPDEYCERSTVCLLNTNDDIKALGIGWSTKSDCFEFNIDFSVSVKTHTKRTVLSFLARVFDPLGWLNAFTTKVKLFLNSLWERNLDWDQTLPSDLDAEWKEIIVQFPLISEITVPRWLQTTNNNKRTELHVFCDSSNKAYATAVYVRTIDSNDNISVNLLIAKSKLTPLRKPLSIPRSELCGAVLAVKLLKMIRDKLRIPITSTHCWTDSTIVLSWIRGDPNRWAVFVSNRIHKILSGTEIENWKHVVSQDNAADCNSRGLSIKQMQECDLWWHGPTWLSQPNSQWPISPFNIVADEQSELRSHFRSINAALNEPIQIDSIISRFSSFNQLKHCFAYVLRFTKMSRTAVQTKSLNSIKSLKLKSNTSNVSPPTVNELEIAEYAIIRWIQHEYFSAELHALRNNQSLTRSNKLARLHPFLDSNQILRVGGRLNNAFIPYHQKHPIILPAKHRIGQLILLQAHKFTIHGGPLITANHVRQRFWIFNLRNQARQVVHRCVTCFKHKPILSRQLMGSLPASRVTMNSRPFSATIVDYAGPYLIRASRGRGQSAYKGYIIVFVCMATKAVHLEAAGDCTSQTFLDALDRFISRRGLCHDLYSDCGTNFIGASNDIKRTYSAFHRLISAEVIPYLNAREIQWHFSPPGAPHFNGLVEAAVKSTKFHLTRIIGETKLTFEEFSTVLTRIEAVLNSRPMSPFSDDPNDFTALTPGHFLIGSALLARPQPPTEENPVKRHQLMNRAVQHFWERFRKDILSTLQIRTKWQTKQPNLKVNDLVIIKDERFPVAQWPLGRIVQLHAGEDALVRVATVKTAHSMLKRPISKLCVLPANDV